LNAWQFDSLFEAQVLSEDHRIDYNMNRSQESDEARRLSSTSLSPLNVTRSVE